MTLMSGKHAKMIIYYISKFILLLGISCSFIIAQNEKGNNPVIDDKESKIVTYSRALLVGISKYDTYRPELKYADSDAKAYYSFLTTKAGNMSNTNNIKLLLNDSATTANIESGIRWLMDVNPNDKVLFYFSGHGDAESDLQPEGFLVCYNTPNGTAATACINMITLMNMVKTLVTKKNANVQIVIDACKSGTITFRQYFSDSPGEQQLEDQKVMKLFSCRPNESSYEDKVWAHQIINNCEGGGAFTYNLLLGMLGFADTEPNDGKVDFFELKSFLEKYVRKQTDKQNPLLYGNPNNVISIVDPNVFSELKSKCDIENIRLQTKGIFLKGYSVDKSLNDSLIIEKYIEFKRCLEFDKLIDPPNNNAYMIYNELLLLNDSDETVKNMKYELIAALRDKSIFALDMYLRGRDIPEFLSLSEANNNLKTILFLIDKNDLFYNEIKAQQLFFEGVLISKDSSEKALFFLNEAIKYVNYAGYIYNELAMIYLKNGLNEEAEINFTKARLYANKWVTPLYNLGMFYYDIKLNYKQSIYYFTKAIKLKTGHLSSYLMRGNSYFRVKKYKLAVKDWEMVIRLDPAYEKELRPQIEEAIRLSKMK